MKTLLIALLLLISASGSAQKCSPRFFAAAPYVKINNGFGFEFGLWPVQDHKFGYLGALQMEVNKITTYDPTKGYTTETIVNMQYIGKTMFRFNRYFYATTQLGLQDMQLLIPGIGLRSVIPIKDKKSDINRYAFSFEPQVTLRQGKMSPAFILSVAFSIN